MLLRAPAKINLYLNVVGKRSDGYHDIQSIFQTVTLFDEIEIFKSDVFSLSLHADSAVFSKGIALERDNLLEKIYIYFRDRYQIGPLRIVLNKQIPIGAGLGGGSSDGAQLIKWINKAYALNLSFDEMRRIGAQFGADIPFFIEGGTAKVEGIGERIEKIEVKKGEQRYLIVYPYIPISTAEAYKKFLTTGPAEGYETLIKVLEEGIDGKNLKKKTDLIYNCFETRLFACYKEMEEIAKLCLNEGLKAFVTGSGSSLVVEVYERGAPLLRLMSALRKKTPFVYEVVNC